MQESPSNSLFGTFENRVNVADWQIMQSVPYNYNETTIVTEQRDPYVDPIDAPFWPRFSENDTVIFAKGYVVQRLVKKDDARDGAYITYEEPSNVEEELGMVVNDTAYVKVTTDEKGEISGTPTIVIFWGR